MNDKPVSELNKTEVTQMLLRRKAEPLYVGSEEVDGMTLCYVNPELVEDESDAEDE